MIVFQNLLNIYTCRITIKNYDNKNDWNYSIYNERDSYIPENYTMNYQEKILDFHGHIMLMT